MIVVLLIGVIFVLILCPSIRCAVFHPFLLIFHSCRDAALYFLHRQYNHYGTGELVAYTGLFGKGKTLSVVHRVVSAYRQYDGKKVWCPRRKKLVTQRVKVISNHCYAALRDPRR